ncbi:MAG: adenosylcobinamide amidohydrolase [Halolamina sp.]
MSPEPGGAFEPTVRDGLLHVEGTGVRWLSSAPGDGFCDADAAYNVTVPEGWDRTDLDVYASERRDSAGFDEPGPTLFTGVDQTHLRGARLDSVVAYATAGLSNPAALSMSAAQGQERETEAAPVTDEEPPVGTVNVIVGTTRALDDGTLASLYGVVVEAKAATLLAETGFPGTTSDAAVVGTNLSGEPATFAGSSTAVGSAARACVRDAVRASLDARYAEESIPESVEAAAYGVSTTRRAALFEP